MNISTLIKYLEKYKEEHGNVLLMSEKDDGRSSWLSPSNMKIVFKKQWNGKVKYHTIEDGGY